MKIEIEKNKFYKRKKIVIKRMMIHSELWINHNEFWGEEREREKKENVVGDKLLIFMSHALLNIEDHAVNFPTQL